jgi:hypothetical protein
MNVSLIEIHWKWLYWPRWQRLKNHIANLDRLGK